MLLSTMPHEHRERLGYYAVGGCGANIAWHTEDDLIHIADPDVLLTDMKIYLAAVMGAANATLAPFDFRRTLATFGRTLDAYEAPLDGLYTFAAARREIAALDAALTRFATHAATLAARPVTDPKVRKANRVVRRLARGLVPVNYTRGPRFFHDPAETTPALPDLAVALQAPSMPAAQRGFLRTHLVRGENRLVATLRDAQRSVARAME